MLGRVLIEFLLELHICARLALRPTANPQNEFICTFTISDNGKSISDTGNCDGTKEKKNQRESWFGRNEIEGKRTRLFFLLLAFDRQRFIIEVKTIFVCALFSCCRSFDFHLLAHWRSRRQARTHHHRVCVYVSVCVRLHVWWEIGLCSPTETVGHLA